MESQRTRYRSTLTACAVTAGLLLLAPATAQARHHGGHGPHSDRGPMFHFLLDRLDLTEDQKDSIQEVVANHHEGTKQIHQKARDARRALRQQVHGDSYDEGGIRQAAADLAAVEVEMALSMGRLFQEVRQFLTPEQIERANLLIEDMSAFRDQMRGHRRERRGHGWSE